MIEGLIFDLDGVLVDTARFHYLAWGALADRWGIAFTEQENEQLKGVSRARSLEILLTLPGAPQLTADEKQAVAEEKNERYLAYVERLTAQDVLPGAREFIEEKRAAGYRIALGSASKNARLVLERLELIELFDALVDGTVVTKAKPDPQVFLRAAELLGIPADRCLVFDDSGAGVTAAHRGGMIAVGVGDSTALDQADALIRGFDAPLDEVERLLAG